MQDISGMNYNLKMSCQVFESINSAKSRPKVCIISGSCVTLWNQVVLLHRYALIFEEVSQDTLESDDNQWSQNITSPSLKNMSESIFKIFTSLRTHSIV